MPLKNEIAFSKKEFTNDIPKLLLKREGTIIRYSTSQLGEICGQRGSF